MRGILIAPRWRAQSTSARDVGTHAAAQLLETVDLYAHFVPNRLPDPFVPSCRCPDSVNFRLKPVVGATYQTLKEKLMGLGKDVQAADPSDLDYEAIKKQLL